MGSIFPSVSDIEKMGERIEKTLSKEKLSKIDKLIIDYLLDLIDFRISIMEESNLNNYEESFVRKKRRRPIEVLQRRRYNSYKPKHSLSESRKKNS